MENVSIRSGLGRIEYRAGKGVRVRTFEIPLAGAKADILHRAHDVILGRHISYFSGFLDLRGLEFV